MFGDVESVVSLADVVSAIVGDVPREPGEALAAVQRDDGSWLLDGALGIDAVSRTLDDEALITGEERQQYHTLGGLARLALGRVPRTGDMFERGEYRFEIVDMDGTGSIASWRADARSTLRLRVPSREAFLDTRRRRAVSSGPLRTLATSLLSEPRPLADQHPPDDGHTVATVRPKHRGFAIREAASPVGKRPRQIRLMRHDDRVSGSRRFAGATTKPQCLRLRDTLHALAAVAKFAHGRRPVEPCVSHRFHGAIRWTRQHISDRDLEPTQRFAHLRGAATPGVVQLPLQVRIVRVRLFLCGCFAR